ncbi:MAG: oligosaccharide repeat unit polymerase [Bacillus sp. (in: firmicutes)]
MKQNLKSTIKRISSIDFFSPAIFFPLVLLAYHVMGNIFDQSRTDMFNLKYSTYPLIFTAIIVYYIVYFLVKKFDIMLPSISIKWFKKLFYVGIIIMTVVGIFSLGYLIFNGQIGLLSESVRRNISPKLNFFSAFLWFGFLILITTYIAKKGFSTGKAIIILCSSAIVILGLYVLIGYRTNLFMIVFTLIIFFHYYFKRFNFILIVTILLITSLSFSLFGNMRVENEDKTEEFNQGMVEFGELSVQTQQEVTKVKEMPEWYRVVTAEFVNGKVVLSRIIEYTEEYGTLNGELHASAIETILPGENQSPRTIVTNVVNTFSDNGIPVTREGRTTTPSLLGQLFLDGGYALLVIGVALISFLLTAIYNRMEHTKRSNHIISYAFITTLLTISIHTGFLDVIFYLFFIAMLVYAMINTDDEDGLKD